MRFWCLVLSLLLAFTAKGQEPLIDPAGPERPPNADVPEYPFQENVGYQKVMRPDWAVAIAANDLERIAAVNPVTALRIRYVMVNDPDEHIAPAMGMASNTALLFDFDPHRPLRVGSEAVWRVDLGEFCGFDPKKLRIMMDTWDRMTDNQFYLPTDNWTVKRTQPYIWKDGKIYESVRVRVVVPGYHADANGQLTRLVELTQSSVPIISIGQYFRFALNSDFGGLYPEFRQFNLAPSKGTAEEAFINRSGVSLDQLGEINADQRVVCWGNPTDNPRLIEYMPSAVTRPSVGPMALTITRDYFKGEIGQDKHPLENLADRKHDGTEIFGPTSSGGLEFSLFDGNGGFVRSAPPNLAADRTVPRGLPILQGPSGCIRCHIATNPNTLTNGIYQPAPNYINYLREALIPSPQGPVRFDIFESSGLKGYDLKRLVSLFKGDTKEAFAYSGRTYARFAYEASGVALEQACTSMMRVHDDWLFGFVTPKKACLTLGYKVETEEQAVVLFNQVCPPAPEPLRITEIRTWHESKRPFKIPIDDWLAVYPEVAFRVAAWEAANLRPIVPKKGETDATRKKN
jgi:hypothetical protein